MFSLFNFQNSVSNDILVIKHTLRDPLVLSSQIYLLSPTGHSLFSFFLFSFFSTFLSFCLSSFSILQLNSFFLFFFFPSFSPFLSQFVLFFSLPFRLSHLRPIKKNQRSGQRIGCCGFVNFLGLCFKLRTEVVVVGIRG